MKMNAMKMYQVYQMYLAQNKIINKHTQLEPTSPSFIPSSIVQEAPEPPKCDLVENQEPNEQTIIDINSPCEYTNRNLENVININNEYSIQDDSVEKKKEDSSLIVMSSLNNYKCTLCKKQLNTQEAFNKHMNKHNFRCGSCGLFFISKEKVKKHLIKKHTDSFVCEIDGKHFGSASGLESHLKAKHPNHNTISINNNKSNKENKKGKEKINDESIIKAALKK